MEEEEKGITMWCIARGCGNSLWLDGQGHCKGAMNQQPNNTAEDTLVLQQITITWMHFARCWKMTDDGNVKKYH